MMSEEAHADLKAIGRHLRALADSVPDEPANWPATHWIMAYRQAMHDVCDLLPREHGIRDSFREVYDYYTVRHPEVTALLEMAQRLQQEPDEA